jgi:hypothetical protein
MRVRLTHATTQVSPTSLERIQQAWAGVPMPANKKSCSGHVEAPLHIRLDLLDRRLLRDVNIYLQVCYGMLKFLMVS